MKRFLFKLALFLILGVIVNVAVAQGFVFTQLSYMSYSDEIELTPWQVQWWVDHAPDGFIPVPEKGRGDMAWRSGLSVNHMEAYNGIFVDGCDLASAGWPLRVIQGSMWYSIESENDIRIVYDAVLPLRGGSRWLLLRPIWPGLAINTIFYALLLWLLTLAPFTARRMIRRKRGLCIKCGYDLRGHPRGASGGYPKCGWGMDTEA